MQLVIDRNNHTDRLFTSISFSKLKKVNVYQIDKIVYFVQIMETRNEMISAQYLMTGLKQHCNDMYT